MAPVVFFRPNTPTSFPEQALFYYIKKAFPIAINKAQHITKNGEILEIDIYIPSLRIGIEYDGCYWHNQKTETDIAKNSSLNEDGIFIIRVRESGLKRLPEYYGKTITRAEPLQKNDTLVKAINSVFSAIKKFLETDRTFKKITTDDFEKNEYDIYSLLFCSPVKDSVFSSSLLHFWDYEKNASLDPKCFPCNNDSIKVHFKCEKGFEFSSTVSKIVEKNSELPQIDCQLSAFCQMYNSDTCKCEIFKHDLILQCIATERQFNTQKGYPCCYYITDEQLLSLILDKGSFIYSSGVEYERLLRFFCLCSVDYTASSFLTKKVFEFVYKEINNQTKINAPQFFESVRHLLKTSELYFMLENSDICKLLLDTFGLDYALERLLKINKGIFQSNTIYISRNFVLIAKQLCQEDLLKVCKKLRTIIPSYEWEFFVAKVRRSVEEYLGKGVLNNETKNKIQSALGEIFVSAKTEQEKKEIQYQYVAKTALAEKGLSKERLREAISFTQSPRKEKYIYDLYKNNTLWEIGNEYRLNGKFMTFPTLDFSFVEDPNETLDIAEIIGMKSIKFNILDFDKEGLRNRFISVAKRSYDSDNQYLYAHGLNERFFEEEINKHLEELSVEFIEALIEFLSYVSSHESRPSSSYTRIVDPEYVLYKLKKRLIELKPSIKFNLKEPPYKRLSSIDVVSFVALEITTHITQPIEEKDETFEELDDEEKYTPSYVKPTTTRTYQNTQSYKKKSSKPENNYVNKKAIVITVALILAFVILVVAISRCSSSQNGYVDLTKHKSVEFVINNGNESYTMERNLLRKPPSVIVIPETYEGKPVTIMAGYFNDYDIIEVIGSKNLIEISENTFADSSDISNMKLEKVIFPQDGSLRYIEADAFFSCNKLKEVVVPEKFKRFGIGAFYGCDNLSSLVIYNLTPPNGADDIFADRWNEGFYDRPNVPFTVYVPDEAVSRYKNSAWSKYSIKPISEWNSNQ